MDFEEWWETGIVHKQFEDRAIYQYSNGAAKEIALLAWNAGAEQANMVLVGRELERLTKGVELKIEKKKRRGKYGA